MFELECFKLYIDQGPLRFIDSYKNALLIPLQLKHPPLLILLNLLAIMLQPYHED